MIGLILIIVTSTIAIIAILAYGIHSMDRDLEGY